MSTMASYAGKTLETVLKAQISLSWIAHFLYDAYPMPELNIATAQQHDINLRRDTDTDEGPTCPGARGGQILTQCLDQAHTSLANCEELQLATGSSASFDQPGDDFNQTTLIIEEGRYRRITESLKSLINCVNTSLTDEHPHQQRIVCSLRQHMTSVFSVYGSSPTENPERFTREYNDTDPLEPQKQWLPVLGSLGRTNFRMCDSVQYWVCHPSSPISKDSVEKVLEIASCKTRRKVLDDTSSDTSEVQEQWIEACKSLTMEAIHGAVQYQKNFGQPGSAHNEFVENQDPKTTIFEDVCTMLPDLDVPVILRWEATRILDKMHKKPHDEDEWRRTCDTLNDVRTFTIMSTFVNETYAAAVNELGGAQEGVAKLSEALENVAGKSSTEGWGSLLYSFACNADADDLDVMSYVLEEGDELGM